MAMAGGGGPLDNGTDHYLSGDEDSDGTFWVFILNIQKFYKIFMQFLVELLDTVKVQ